MKHSKLEERNKKIVELRRKGLKLQQLADLYNLSIQHIIRILQDAK